MVRRYQRADVSHTADIDDKLFQNMNYVLLFYEDDCEVLQKLCCILFFYKFPDESIMPSTKKVRRK